MILKKTIILLAATILIFCFSSTAWADGEVTVLVDNQQVSFPDQKPYIDGNDRTLVPVRFISEAMGAVVDWEGTTRTVTIVRRQNTIKLKIGESKAMVNDQVKTFDTKAVITNSRTMVPLRFISETLGARVEWLSQTRTVKITTDNGYLVPEKTELYIEIPPAYDNPNQVDIDVVISIEEDLEKQFQDLHNIISSKFGKEAAKQVTDHVRAKKDRWSEVPEKYWTFNGQQICAASNAGGYTIQIVIWLPGVQ